MLTLDPGPVVVPQPENKDGEREKEDDGKEKEIVYQAVRSNLRLKIAAQKKPGPRKHPIKVEATAGKGKEKASAASQSQPTAHVSSPINNDLREFESVQDYAAMLHEKHSGKSNVIPCKCCFEGAKRLYKPPPPDSPRNWSHEDPANMPDVTDSSSDASEEIAARSSKRAKGSDTNELMLTKPFKPKSPESFQPHQPSSLQQMQLQSDILPEIPQDPMVNYPPSVQHPIPPVDLTHFGHNPHCAQGTLGGIYPVELADHSISSDLCCCGTEDNCNCVGCADHPGNRATVTHVMEALNFQATDAWYNNPDVEMRDVSPEEDDLSGTSPLPAPQYGCCGGKTSAPVNTAPSMPAQAAKNVVLQFPTFLPNQGPGNVASSSNIAPIQTPYAQPLAQRSHVSSLTNPMAQAHMPEDQDENSQASSSREPLPNEPFPRYDRGHIFSPDSQMAKVLAKIEANEAKRAADRIKREEKLEALALKRQERANNPSSSKSSKARKKSKSQAQNVDASAPTNAPIPAIPAATQPQSDEMPPEGQINQASSFTDVYSQAQTENMQIGGEANQVSYSTDVYPPAQLMPFQDQGSYTSPSTVLQPQNFYQQPQDTTNSASTSLVIAPSQAQYLQSQGLGQGSLDSALMNTQGQAQYAPNPLTLGSNYNPNLTPQPTLTMAQLFAYQQQLREQQDAVQALLEEQVYNMPYYGITNNVITMNNDQTYNNMAIVNNNNQTYNNMYDAGDAQQTTDFVMDPMMDFTDMAMAADTINPNVLQQGQDEEEAEFAFDGGAPITE